MLQACSNAMIMSSDQWFVGIFPGKHIPFKHVHKGKHNFRFKSLQLRTQKAFTPYEQNVTRRIMLLTPQKWKADVFQCCRKFSHHAGICVFPPLPHPCFSIDFKISFSSVCFLKMKFQTGMTSWTYFPPPHLYSYHHTIISPNAVFSRLFSVSYFSFSLP